MSIAFVGDMVLADGNDLKTSCVLNGTIPHFLNPDLRLFDEFLKRRLTYLFNNGGVC